MPEIDHLALQLPAGFEKRAARLARLTAQALAGQPLPASGTLALVSPAPLRLDARRSDAALAGVLARHIAGGIHRAGDDGPAGGAPC